MTKIEKAIQWESESADLAIATAKAVKRALKTPAVMRAMAKAPDGDWISTGVVSGVVEIMLTTRIQDEPAELADAATAVDATHWRVDVSQTLLNTKRHRVTVRITGRTPLSKSDIKTLRDLGKIKTVKETYKTVSCSI